jgi:hypothetical protein
MSEAVADDPEQYSRYPTNHGAEYPHGWLPRETARQRHTDRQTETDTRDKEIPRQRERPRDREREKAPVRTALHLGVDGARRRGQRRLLLRGQLRRRLERHRVLRET